MAQPYQKLKPSLKKMAGTVHNYILMGQLEQLYKGGRMSGVQFFIGSLLKVKPIVQITTEGELEPSIKYVPRKKHFNTWLIK